jgi:hypothetical protein
MTFSSRLFVESSTSEARGSQNAQVRPQYGVRTDGGAEGIRTPGLLDANEARYQLRYSPVRDLVRIHRATRPPESSPCLRSMWVTTSACATARR